MTAGEGAWAVVVLDDGHRRVPVGRVLPGADLATVDALARLVLAARRRGLDVHLAAVAPRLGALLQLVGLGAVLAGPRLPASVEVGGEAEGGEQERGVEERVHAGDAVAGHVDDLERPRRPAAGGVDPVLPERRPPVGGGGHQA